MILMYFLPNVLVSHFEGVFEHMNQEAADGDKGVCYLIATLNCTFINLCSKLVL
jgi:hypothetical protein